QLRLPERFEAERGQGARRMEPRLGSVPGAPGVAPGGASGAADAPDVIPTRFDAPEAEERLRRPAREERRPPEAALARGPVPSAAAAPERFDAIRPSEYRNPDTPDAEWTPAPPAQAPLAAGTGAGDLKSPPLSPGDAAGSAAMRP